MTHPRVPLTGDGAKGMIHYEITRVSNSKSPVEEYLQLNEMSKINRLQAGLGNYKI
jgi:hypothetical protein